MFSPTHYGGPHKKNSQFFFVSKPHICGHYTEKNYKNSYFSCVSIMTMLLELHWKIFLPEKQH